MIPTYRANKIRLIIFSLIFIFASANAFVHNYKTGTGASNMPLKHRTASTVKPRYSSLRLIDSIPAPPGEMRMGLTEEGDYLWIFTNTTESYSVFYKIKKNDGLIIRQFNFPDTTPRYNIGLTMINGYLYTSEFYPIPGNIHILDTLGNFVRTFNTGYDTRGLAWDGTYLWATEADSQSILKMDTIGNVIATYKNDGSIQWFMDITYDDNDSTIWANYDAFALDINEISVDSSPFLIIQYFDHPSPQSDIPEGITYCDESDGGYLYTNGVYSQFIWKIKVHDGGISEKNGAYHHKCRFGPVLSTIFTDQIFISYKIVEQQSVRLNIYETNGTEVCAIVDGIVNPGEYKVVWNGKDDNNRRLPAGIYFIRFESAEYKSTIKVIKMK